MLGPLCKSSMAPRGVAKLFVRCLRSIPTDRLKKLVEDQDDKMSNLIVPGHDRPSSWFLPELRNPAQKVVGLRPVKPLPVLRICIVREGCTNRPFFTIQVIKLKCLVHLFWGS